MQFAQEKYQELFVLLTEYAKEFNEKLENGEVDNSVAFPMDLRISSENIEIKNEN